MEPGVSSPRYTLSQPRNKPILLPDQQQAISRFQPEVKKKKTPPPRPRRKDLFHSPPPILPARNPLRSPTGVILPPREPIQIWDPEIGNYVKRLPEGGFGGIVDDRMGIGSGTFGGPSGLADKNGRKAMARERSTNSILPGMEIALRTNTAATIHSHTPGIGRSSSVNDGRSTSNTANNTTSLSAPAPRLLNATSINATDRPLSHPAAAGPGQEFSRTLHEQVSNLRQSFLNSLHITGFETELESDGKVFTNALPSTPTTQTLPNNASTPPPPLPSTPLHRSISNPSASASSQQASIRNFSLPSYDSPTAKEQQQRQFALESRSLSGPLPLPSANSMWDLHTGDAGTTTNTTPKQKTPRRPLRRVRSRSVNLGRIAEAGEAPRMPARRLEWWDQMGGKAVEMSRVDGGHGKKEEEERTVIGSGLDVEVGQLTATAATATTKPKRKVWKEVEEVEEEEALKEEQEEEEEEEACGRCKSIRRALARNPLCCVDRAKAHRLCFKCWSESLAEGLKKEERERWLCCVVCGRELLSVDVRRLASKGTIFR